MEIRDDDDLKTLELISAAALAGAYWTLAREYPDHAGGLVKKAVQHSARVTALAGRLMCGGGAVSALPPRRAL